MSNVLVVENNHMIRTMYAAGLSGYGYNVYEAQSINEAKLYLQQGLVPDVILLDLHLAPNEPTGHELIRYIRQELRWNDVKIIVATGLDTSANSVLALGADRFLTKPIEMVELLDLVQEASISH